MDYAALNKMLEARAKELAGRHLPRNRAGHEKRLEEQRVQLQKSLGLYPPPPRTALNAAVTSTLIRNGYRIDKVRFESRPGVLVTAHLYLPESGGPHPLILSPHGHFEFKKSTPLVQARGIGLALLGFACFIVESPGYSWDDNEWNERRAMGTHDDPWLAMGYPVQGQYVWDLVRGLDYCESRADIDATRVGITGASGGGTATMYAFAFDERIKAAAPVCSATSLETRVQNGCFCNHLPGVLEIGDRSDVLALQAPNPICLIGATDDPEFPLVGHQESYRKLQAIYRLYRADTNVRLEIVEGKHDYNRRMREAMYAFFCEHLLGQPRRGHVPEPIPLTDGHENPYESGTEDARSHELLVTSPEDRGTKTFRELLEQTFTEPHPSEFEPQKRLVPWEKFGPLNLNVESGKLILKDGDASDQPGSYPMNSDALDIRLLIYLGMSPAEFMAQIFHMFLPGKPENWEANVLQGDAITSMIASVKTLVKGTESQEPVVRVEANGPFSSLAARHLGVFRPNLELELSHQPGSWRELYDEQNVGLLQPNARYLKWPY